MATVAETLTLALKFHQAGHIEQAHHLYHQILQAAPDCADALHLLGLLTHQIGQSTQAINYIQQATVIDPVNPLFYSSLALIYRELGDYEQAAANYQQALKIQPDNAEEHYHLGIVLNRLERFEQAIASFQQALHLRPSYPEVYDNLGITLSKQGKLDKAIAYFQQALQLRPNYVEAHHNLGVTLGELGEYTKAARHIQQALEIRPGCDNIHYSLGQILEQQGQLEAAETSYRQALHLKPKQSLWQLKIDGLWPAIISDSQAINDRRIRFETALDRYSEGSIDLNQKSVDVLAANIYPPFQLPYHGQNDLRIKTKYASLFKFTEPSAVSHSSAFVSQNKPYRLGFLVTRGHEGIFLNLARGIINNLRTPDFDVSIICPLTSIPRIASMLENEQVKFVSIPQNLEGAVQKIKAEKFHLIYYWEVGSDALNYFLPFFRLAAVQCTSWGLSITTGIPEMDYFISSDLLEVAEADKHYSERLIKLKTLPTYYYRPIVPIPLKSRAYFGLSDQDHLYLCPQNLLKFHPDFDKILGQILRHDPKGKLVLLEAKTKSWQEQLWRRFQTNIPDVISQIQWVPQLSYPDFINLMAVSDVMLDTIHYSGGNTSHEGLGVGIPIVTCPSKFLRGRLTLGRYKKIGVMDCVAIDSDEYVKIALRLGTDSMYREMIKAKILAANYSLYEDMEAVQELAQFFREAIETTYKKV